MRKYEENNGTEEIGLVTPTPGDWREDFPKWKMWPLGSHTETYKCCKRVHIENKKRNLSVCHKYFLDTRYLHEILTDSWTFVWRYTESHFYISMYQNVSEMISVWCNYNRADSGSGVGVTQPISPVPLFSEFFSIVKIYEYWISRPYSRSVSAAQLRWHLSNMNVIQGIERCLCRIENFA